MTNSIMPIREDVKVAKELLKSFPKSWDGRQSVSDMNQAGFRWHTTEWWKSYYEYMCVNLLSPQFKFPKGFSAATYSQSIARQLNWALCIKAVGTDSSRIQVTDSWYVHQSISRFGCCGAMIALFKPEFGDQDRSFLKWMELLESKGRASDDLNEPKTATSSFRIVHADLVHILFLEFTQENLSYLDTFVPGRFASTGRGIPLFSVDIQAMKPFVIDQMSF